MAKKAKNMLLGRARADDDTSEEGVGGEILKLSGEVGPRAAPTIVVK